MHFFLLRWSLLKVFCSLASPLYFSFLRMPRTVLECHLPPAMVTEVNLDEGAAALSPLLVAARQIVLVRQGELVHGWLYLERGSQPRTVGEVLQAMLAQLDHTLLLGTPVRTAQRKVTTARL